MLRKSVLLTCKRHLPDLNLTNLMAIIVASLITLNLLPRDWLYFSHFCLNVCYIMVIHLKIYFTIVSIPKDVRGNQATSDNYRGIAHSNALCKIVDMWILDKLESYLQTSN